MTASLFFDSLLRCGCGIVQLPVGVDLDHTRIGYRADLAGSPWINSDQVEGETVRTDHYLDRNGVANRDPGLVGELQHASTG